MKYFQIPDNMNRFTPLDDRLFEFAANFLNIDPLIDGFIDDFVSDVMDVEPLAISFAKLIESFGSMDGLELSMQESVTNFGKLPVDELKRQRQIIYKCLELMLATVERYKSIDSKLKKNEHKFKLSDENIQKYNEMKTIINQTIELYKQRSIDMKTCMVGLFYLNSLHNLYIKLSNACEEV